MTTKSEALTTHLILSLKWSGKNNEPYATWYRPESKGYVWSINHAGLFTEEEATRHNGSQERGIPLWLAKKHAVDSSHEREPSIYLPIDNMEYMLLELFQIESEASDE